MKRRAIKINWPETESNSIDRFPILAACCSCDCRFVLPRRLISSNSSWVGKETDQESRRGKSSQIIKGKFPLIIQNLFILKIQILFVL